MTWTIDEHKEGVWRLYHHDDVGSGLVTVGNIDALGAGLGGLYEQFVVEDHPEYAWVWEDEQ